MLGSSATNLFGGARRRPVVLLPGWLLAVVVLLLLQCCPHRHGGAVAVEAAVVLAEDGTAASSSAAAAAAAAAAQSQSSQSSSQFTPFERSEHRAAWNAIRTACEGCWSGAMSRYQVIVPSNNNTNNNNTSNNNNDNTLQRMQLADPPKRNFRLRVQTSGSTGTGTWTVWNLLREGDETVVPLRQTPPLQPQQQQPTQLKIGFAGAGVILRVPREISARLPRVVLEIGFWDRTHRRTAVLEYRPQPQNQQHSRLPPSVPPSFLGWLWRRKGQSQQQQAWQLDDITVVQMRRRRSRNFVGNATVARDVSILPTAAPFDWADLPWSRLQLQESIAVNLTTMQRETLHGKGAQATAVERRLIQALVPPWSSNGNRIDDDHQHHHHRAHCSFRQVLPNALCVAVPHRFESSSSSSSSSHPPEEGQEDDTVHRCLFAHRPSRKILQVVQVEYDCERGSSTLLRAQSVTLHTLRILQRSSKKKEKENQR